MNRAAIIGLLFVSIVMTLGDSAISSLGIWLINRAAALIAYAKEIEP